MRLVYKNTQQEVKVGDEVTTSKGQTLIVKSFNQPHKPSSSGLVELSDTSAVYGKDATFEMYVGVIGAEWIEREDRREYESI